MTPDPNSTPEISSRYEDRPNPYKQTINGIEVSHVTRSKSATCVETKLEKRTMMVKSASEKRMPVEEKEEERRPATTRETVSFGEDEAVDSKADDFINKFRNQLKLQRLDSIIRYKEMLNRGVSR
ncbi:pathogen-associated molecular patterns-induced protein A70-like [Lycium ferocissimum]|uniref:pathogen-associated molecular patterns-induced protein A70-like n=1 Tax=Lycium ferocissimum TaxID=112874 RepID=UPI0028152D2D|nr:pathogen-associated molecular patterns-induced protein A70-like [Lycium ferocissimum]